MQVIDTALVNIVSGQTPDHGQAAPARGRACAKAMQNLLDYFVGEDHLVEKQPAFVQQG
jgi:hypothetical protein